MTYKIDVTTMTPEEVTRFINDRAEKISPHLAGLPPMVTSAILADLLATLLAGLQPKHPDDIEDQLHAVMARETLLTETIGLVKKLLPVNEEIILRRYREKQDAARS